MGDIWLDGYEGQTTDELLALEPTHRIDSLIVALRQAIGQKEHREGKAALSPEERLVDVVGEFEDQVNNGGFSQFFENSPEYVAEIVPALRRIGCVTTAALTERAIAALAPAGLSEDEVKAAMARDDANRDATLGTLDDEFFATTGESIEQRLFDFVKKNGATIRVP